MSPHSPIFSRKAASGIGGVGKIMDSKIIFLVVCAASGSSDLGGSGVSKLFRAYRG
jgi:hypothetical protein